MKQIIASVMFGLIVFSNILGQEQLPPPPKPTPKPLGISAANDYFPQRWNEFISVESGFKVKLPVVPQERVLVDNTKSEVTGRKYRAGSENFIVYSLEAIETSSSDKFQKDEKFVFQAVKEERTRNFESPVTLLSELTSFRGGCPASYAEFESKGKFVYRELYVFCGDKFYIVSIRTFKDLTGPTLRSYSEIAKEFISSFELLEEEELKSLKSTVLQSSGKFKDEENRFSVKFPKYPEIIESFDEGRIVDISFTAESDEFSYEIIADTVTTTFSFSEHLREKLYDNWRKGFITGSKGKLISESSFNFRSVKGRALTVSLPNAANPLIIRVLAMNGRFYSMLFSDLSETVTKERSKAASLEAEAFFNSFEKLNESKPPKYLGLVYRNNYTSEYFGISMNTPKGWEINGGQVMATFDDKQDDIVFDVENLDILEPPLLGLTNAEKNLAKRAFMNLEARFYRFPSVTLAEVARVTGKIIVEKEKNLELVKDFSRFDINGVEAWKATFKFDESVRPETYLLSYFLKHENYMFTINAAYVREEDKKKIENSVNSLRLLQR